MFDDGAVQMNIDYDLLQFAVQISNPLGSFH